MYWRRMYAKGKPHPPYNKVFQGCGLTLGIIIILIGPILLFSDITPLSDRMPVVDAQLKLAIKTSGGGLSDGGALIETVASYATPAGAEINERGIAPDEERIFLSDVLGSSFLDADIKGAVIAQPVCGTRR